MRLQGLKIVTASLVPNDILNIRLQELNPPYLIRNINFIIPIDVNASEILVKVNDNNKVSIHAPMKTN